MPFVLLFAAAALIAIAAGKGAGASSPPWGPKHLPTAADVEPGMPPEILAAVDAAISIETDPAKLRGFADALNPYYPKAAATLYARSRML